MNPNAVPRAGALGAAVLMATVASAEGVARPLGVFPGNEVQVRKMQIGRQAARAILTCHGGESDSLAILIPGSGPNGPEEMMHPEVTLDGKETSIFASFAQSLRAGGFHTLQLGKPGVEFFRSWDDSAWFYDFELFQQLAWADLVENVNDAIAFAERERPCGTRAVVLVGHSEGTMVAADVAKGNPAVRGLVLLGFSGRPYRDVVEWQLYERPIELFVSSDLDADHDGFITRAEGARWPAEFAYPWSEGEESVAVADVAAAMRASPELAKLKEAFETSPLMSNGNWDRAPLYPQVAALRIPVLAFTGSVDVQTPPSELAALAAACWESGKTDCELHTVPGLGHGFSSPKPPRAHRFLDATIGPVEPGFAREFAVRLADWRGTRLKARE